MIAWQKDTGYLERGHQMVRQPRISGEHESLGELLGELAGQSASLVRDEVALAQQEIREKLKTVQSAVLVIAVGALLGVIAVMALCAALIMGLAEYIPLWQSALVVAVALSVAAGIAVMAGIGQLKRTNFKPEQTIETLEENKEWLKEIT